MTLEEQLSSNASVLHSRGYVLHTTVENDREVNYQLTHPSGKQENIRGMITFNLNDLRPQVFVPASLQERFGSVVVDATLVAWAFAEGICA
jgi:hypothetical protein